MDFPGDAPWKAIQVKGLAPWPPAQPLLQGVTNTCRAPPKNERTHSVRSSVWEARGRQLQGPPGLAGRPCPRLTHRAVPISADSGPKSNPEWIRLSREPPAQRDPPQTWAQPTSSPVTFLLIVSWSCDLKQWWVCTQPKIPSSASPITYGKVSLPWTWRTVAGSGVRAAPGGHGQVQLPEQDVEDSDRFRLVRRSGGQ